MGAGSVLAAIESELACFRQGLQESITVLLEQTTKEKSAAASQKKGTCLDNVVLDFDNSSEPVNINPGLPGARGFDAGVIQPRPQASLRASSSKHPGQLQGDVGSEHWENVQSC